MNRYIQPYLDQGYEVVDGLPTCIGSEFAFNFETNRVVKFSQDPAYHKFVRYAMNNQTETRLPVFYSHTECGNDDLIGGEPWGTITVMERLFELTEEEGSIIVNWMHELSQSISANRDLQKVTNDPFGLLALMRSLWGHAQLEQVGFDTLKSSNFLVRKLDGTRCVIVTDPYN